MRTYHPCQTTKGTTNSMNQQKRSTPETQHRLFATSTSQRAPIKRQTLARSRHPPMESDEPTDERVSYTPVPPKHVTNSGDSSADSHVNNTCNEPARLANRREPSPQTETERSTRTTASHYNLRANIAPTRYSDHLVHEISNAKTKLRPVTLRTEAADTTGNRSRHTSENIRCIRSSRKHKTTLSEAHRKTLVPMHQLNSQRCNQSARHRKTSVFPIPHVTNIV